MIIKIFNYISLNYHIWDNMLILNLVLINKILEFVRTLLKLFAKIILNYYIIIEI